MTQSLLSRVSNPDAIRANPFLILKEIASRVSRAAVDGFEDVDTQKIVLYALENKVHFGELREVLDGMVRSRGLYPYMNKEALSERELLAYEAHRPSGLTDVVFHQEQAEVYLRLMSGENVVLSAPTSFGKSLIVDALIASGNYRNVCVVVPTIALIDETRRRLSTQFGGAYKLITHPGQIPEAKNIYVMTQERVLDLEKISELDLFVIDEFYKLDPRRDADRALLLNQAFYKLLKTGAQFYMLGPNIERIPENFTASLRSTFISTPYATVVSEHVPISATRSDALEKLVGLCDELQGQTLIYCASPASARRVATALTAARRDSKSKELINASEWVGENYHPDWIVARALSNGVGVHHGKVPRALSQYAVRAFNDGRLKFLICTSTLIEGVNTKAKNVVIYDNRVATKKFDYFTFNNIRGRSGRMFQHFVGRVYLFNAPPQDDLPFVDIPVVNQTDDTPDSLLIQLEAEDLRGPSVARMERLSREATLSIETLKRNAGIDPGAQMRLAEELRSDGRYFHDLRWTGFPDYEQLVVACELIWNHFVGAGRLGGISSGRQLAFRIDRLRRARTIKKLILQELASQESPDADDAVEDVLDFVRTWASFHFPRYLMALDRIQREVFLPWIGAAGDYSAYAANVENMFTSSGLVALDEFGVPLQVAEKIATGLGDHSSVDGVLAGLRAFRVESVATLSEFERALIRDAQNGLGPQRVEVGTPA
jgi:hypothetical protein